MPVNNSDIADLFDEMADILEIQGENPFRVRAYRNASRVVRNWPARLSSIVSQGQPLPKMPGIGQDLAGKVDEAIRTRRLRVLETLKRKTPSGLVELLKIPGLGPKRVARLQSDLGVQSVSDLKRQLEAGGLGQVEGFGPRIEQKLREEMSAQAGAGSGRIFLARAEQIAEPLLAHLREIPGVQRSAVGGSFRRRWDTVGDLDLLVSCDDHQEVMRRFLSYEEIDQVLSRGATRSTVVLRSGLQVDLRVVDDASFGAALHYFTGSKAHNIAIRTLGIKRGLKINEYGVFRGKRSVAGKTEEEVFRCVGLPYIEPELREDQGEIQAARAGALPDLVTLEGIRGDLHAHSKATDGRLSIEAMAQAAMALGYEYLAITDHSRRLTVARGLDVRRLRAQIREIDRLNGKLEGTRKKFRILKSIEVDILEDGSLDLPDSILSELDLTVCSVHSRFMLSPKKQLDRILRAMDHPSFHILGHPTGRLIGQRPASEYEMEKVMAAARDRGCFLEINAQPERMDLADRHCRLAKQLGVMVVISTDAHSDHDLGYMKFGVSQARRGWLEPKDVLNTRSWKEIQTLLLRRGSRAAAA